jgi:hypothetical protein
VKTVLYIQFTDPAAYPPLEHSSKISLSADCASAFSVRKRPRFTIWTGHLGSVSWTKLFAPHGPSISVMGL